MLTVELARGPRKTLDGLQPPLVDRLRDKMRLLANDPVPHGAVRVEGEPGRTFRVRVGDYRILYRIEQEHARILIITIDKRSRAYHHA